MKVKPLVLICILAAMQFMADNMIRQLIPLHVGGLGGTPETIGIIVSSYSLLPLFLAIPGGVIVDRVGYRTMITVGSLTIVLACLLLLQFPVIWVIGVAQLLSGIGNVLVILASQAYVSMIGTSRQRTHHFAVYSFAMSAGFLVGPPLGGLLTDLNGFAFTFGTAGAICALSILLTQRLPEPGRAVASVASGVKGQVRETIGHGQTLLRKHDVQLALFISIVALFVLSLRTSFYPVYLQNIGFSTGHIGTLISIQSVVALIFRPFLGQLVQRFGLLRVVVSAMTAGAFGMGITPLLTTWGALALASAMTGLTTTFTQPISMILMAQGSDRDSAGLAMGLRQSSNQLGSFLGPVVLGVAVSLMGLPFSFVLCGLLLLLAALLLVIVVPRYYRDVMMAG